MSTHTKQSGSATSTSTTTNNPADWAANNYHTGASAALNDYNSGQGSQVYQGQRVPDSLSALTQQGQSNLNNTANSFAGQTPESVQNLAQTASNPVNPFFQQALNNELSNVGSQTNESSAAQGLGSSAAQQQLGTTLGQTATQALSNQYNTGVQQQIAANDLIDRQRAAYAGEQGALAGQQAQSGLLNTALQQAQENAAQQKFNETQMSPWKQLGLLAAGTNSFAAPYGTSTSTGSENMKGSGTSSGMNPFMSALGGGLGIASLWPF